VKADWSPENVEKLRELWASGKTAAVIARLFGDGRTRNSVIGKVHALKLTREKRKPKKGGHFHNREGGRVRKAYASRGDDATFSRFVKVPASEREPAAHRPPSQMWLPGTRHEAVVMGRSIFHRRGVKPVAELKNLLVSGHSNVKIGRDVRHGRLFRGYWIYTLSLEERATCPSSCHHWQTCYGNNMPYAKRVDHRDPAALQARLRDEVAELLSMVGVGPTLRTGVLVRLHALGDFFDEDYVDFWSTLLTAHDRLAVFGYTAHSPDSPIGLRIAAAKVEHGRRFAIRWSNGGPGARLHGAGLPRGRGANGCVPLPRASEQGRRVRQVRGLLERRHERRFPRALGLAMGRGLALPYSR
jgi:hypothetical protein